ncbi:hypothetical protein [Streptomyces sp. NPDC058953]|uniref:hypothetical protein n=1 Tax=unclassified Streptomyces TaxID=2593676 RepID=UPI00367A0147
MAASLDELEERLSELRTRLRAATRTRDAEAKQRIRAALRETEEAWEAVLAEEDEGSRADGAPPGSAAPTEPGPTGPAGPGRTAVPAGKDPHAGPPARAEGNGGRVNTPAGARARTATIPVREQVHQALTLLGAPASPKLISSVYEAFFSEPLIATKLASLRRDEERSFTAQGYARPYYICAALTHDRLTPARGLLAVSTWPLPRRIVGPLSPRTDFLTHAVGTAEQILRLDSAGHPPGELAWRLLRRFALTIPGAYEGDHGRPDPARVMAAARAEAAVHTDADRRERESAAARARGRLPDAQQLFGAPPLRQVRAEPGD